MRRKFQKIIDPVDGDCLRACISTITEISVSELPANSKDTKHLEGYYGALRDALAKHGWMFVSHCKIDYWWLYAALGNVPLIASVPSQKFPGKIHAVVVAYDLKQMKLRVVHDPNPLNGPYDFFSPDCVYDYSLLIRKEGLPQLNKAALRQYKTRSRPKK